MSWWLKLFFLLVFSTVTASAAWAFGLRESDGSISGTNGVNKHDFSAAAGAAGGNVYANNGETEVCIFCHTPHSASAESVLWNRQFPVMMGGFPIYGGTLAINTDVAGAADYSVSNQEYPNGASRMCLSCHDGATSIGDVITGVIETNYTTITDYDPSNSLGLAVDLSTSHPISFYYTTSVVGQINVSPNRSGTFTDPATFGAAEDALLRLDLNGRMQCTTCHDPHDDTLASLGTPFWRNDSVDAGGSDYVSPVCDACHISAPGGASH